MGSTNSDLDLVQSLLGSAPSDTATATAEPETLTGPVSGVACTLPEALKGLDEQLELITAAAVVGQLQVVEMVSKATGQSVPVLMIGIPSPDGRGVIPHFFGTLQGHEAIVDQYERGTCPGCGGVPTVAL
jgi:hypothetical protein